VNNSGEPLDDLLAGLPWGARVLTPGRNLGYARGVNEGIRASREDLVLVLNPDLVARPGSIQALVRCAEENPRAGIVAPRLLNADGTLQLSARRFYNWKTLLLRRAPLGPYAARSRTLRDHLMADWDHAETREVDWVLGAAMLARRRAIRDVGLMDERYFLYFEDVDWCQRMWRHGWEVLYCAESTMVHEYGRRSAQLDPRSIRAHAAGLLRFTEKWSALLYAVSQYRRRLLSVVMFLTDVAAVALAFLVSYGIRASLASFLKNPVYPLESYGGLLFFSVVVTVLALAANGLYRRTEFADGIELSFRVGQVVLQSMLFLMAATFLFQTPRYSRVLVLLNAPVLFAALLVTRGLLGRAGEGARRRGFAFRRVLVMGSGFEADRVRDALEGARGEGYEPLGTMIPAGGETPERAVARLRALIQSERIQIVCLAPEPEEVPMLLAATSPLRDSGAAVYWAGTVAQLAGGENLGRLGPVRALLIHAPSRGLSVRVRKRATDLLLSLFVVPFRWGALRAYLARRGEGYGPAEAWGRVWSGRLSWVGRSEYEAERWERVPEWARLALQSVRPGVVTPRNGGSTNPMASVRADLEYVARFSMAEDLRRFLSATSGDAP
jgi:GT2 family glycosyltransferase